MQIKGTQERRIPRLQKPLENNLTLYITHHLGGFLRILRKKAALIMHAVLLMIIVAGCGGGESFSVSGTDSQTAGDPGGTNITGSGTNITGNGSGSAGYNVATTGSATLAWDAPVTNTDGTPLTDLAGYKIYYGTSSGNYTTAIDVGNVTRFTVTDLSPGTFYFAVVSYDSSRIESDYSNEASKIIQ